MSSANEKQCPTVMQNSQVNSSLSSVSYLNIDDLELTKVTYNPIMKYIYNYIRFPPLNKCSNVVNAAEFTNVCIQQTCECLIETDGDERGCK